MERLTADQITAAELADWRRLAQALHARFLTEDVRAGLAFAAALADAVTTHERDPRVSVHAAGVDVVLRTSRDGWWVTPADVESARRVSEVAREQGLRPDPDAVAQVEMGMDTARAAALAPFWAAILLGDGTATTHGEVIDATGQVPDIWFQPTDEHETPRQRWHPDVWVAPESVAARIEAAVAVGGAVLDDSSAPSFTVLADPDGNKVCLCTSLDRD